MNTAIIFDIQRNSFVDGPGIRTTVFFKGCNLKCKWCHNPESQSAKPQIMFYKDKCTGCGRCKGITEKDTEFVCFNDAKQICGKEYTVEEVFNIIQKDKPFYEMSNGGVTFSGGECMLQINFLYEILKKLFERKAKVLIRIPVIPTVNDSIEEMGNIRRFLAPYKPFAVELLPYHKMGEHKYTALGMNMTSFDIPSPKKLKELNRIFMHQ